MEISVRRLEQVSDSEWLAELGFGDASVSSVIEVADDGELRGFHFREPMFGVMLAWNGLEGEFSKRFFAYMDSGVPEIPWCFGEHDDEIIKRVWKHYEPPERRSGGN
jgi:hypothetical protein